ncbi:MAG: hypothetical protein Tsb0019_06620 [Roseibium sp.]
MVPRLAILAIATISLTSHTMVASETGGIGTCAPVVEHSRDFQARAAEELASLPHGSAIGEMLSDYAVMRDQARAGE